LDEVGDDAAADGIEIAIQSLGIGGKVFVVKL
jgi:hypothetical protein